MRDDERRGRGKEVSRPDLIGQRVRVRRRLEFHSLSIVWKLI